MKIGIIIPNYNNEKWLDKCLTSIVNQTYKNYEVIFIDDMSTDNSVNIAYNYVEKLTDMQIVELKQKRYNGGARNEGYLYLSDDVDYVYYIDSDDWLYDENALKSINEALIDKPDVLFVGIAKYQNNITTKESLPTYDSKYKAIQGWSGSCGKVIKKELATKQECLYNEGTLKEDKNQHFKICIYMNSFKCLNKLIYVYNLCNATSTTKVRDKITWGTSTIRHYADTLQLALSVKGKDKKIDEILQERLIKCKNEMLNNGDKQY